MRGDEDVQKCVVWMKLGGLRCEDGSVVVALGPLLRVCHAPLTTEHSNPRTAAATSYASRPPRSELEKFRSQISWSDFHNPLM